MVQTFSDSHLDSQGVPSGVRRSIDIEQLLVWAFRDQLAAGNSTLMVHERDPAYVAGGAAVVASGGTTGCAADAITIVRAVGRLALPEYVDDWAKRWLLPSAAPGAIAVLVGERGARVIEAKPTKVEPDWTPATRAWALLRQHARTGSRPDWRPGARHRLVPQLDQDGRPRVDREPGGKRPVFCHIAPMDSPEIVHALRQDYSLWRCGLVAVRDLLLAGGELEQWTPTGPAAPEQPWDDRRRVLVESPSATARR